MDQILAWADRYREKTGHWPAAGSGRVAGAGVQTWKGVNDALGRGHRGLPGGSSLAQLLAEHRGKQNRTWRPRLTEEQVLAWADAHHERTGRWPNQASGAVADAPGETWREINNCLERGSRGLPGGDTLARLLEERRGVRRWARQA